MTKKFKKYIVNSELILNDINKKISFLQEKLFFLNFNKFSIKFKAFNLLTLFKKDISKLKLKRSEIKNYNKKYDTNSN
jgi:hypothetical protein